MKKNKKISLNVNERKTTRKFPTNIREYLKSFLHLVLTFSDNHPYPSHASIKFGSCFLAF